MIDLLFQPVMTRSPLTPMTSSPTLRWLTRGGGEVCAGVRMASSQPITWRFGNDGTPNPTSHLRIWAQRPRNALVTASPLSFSFHPSPSPPSLCFSSFPCLGWNPPDGSGLLLKVEALVNLLHQPPGGAVDVRWLCGPKQWLNFRSLDFCRLFFALHYNLSGFPAELIN